MYQRKSGYWTKEHCAEEAKKYSTRTQFQRMASGAWSAANKKGWLEEICSHMEIRWQRKWDTKEKCAKEAEKYSNRTDFQTVNQLFPNSYHNFVDRIFVKAYTEEEYVEVVSKYGSCKYPIDKQSRWESGEIGLSYACCEVSITFIP